MENDPKEKIQRISAQERHLLAVKRKMKWWTSVLVLLTLVALGLFGMAVYPDFMQKTFGIELKAKAADNKAAYLGVEIQDLKEGMAETLNLRYSGGVVISRVAPSSPAVEGGLKAGDIILRYNRSGVESASGLQDMLAAASPGDRTKFVVDRNGQIRTFYVVLGERPSNIVQTAGITLAQTNTIMEWGCTLSPLAPVLVQKLSIPSSIKGVVVVAVATTGLAKSAGILPGDVIVSVNREPVEDLAGFYKAIENEETLALEIYRSGRVIYLKMQQSLALPPLATIAGSLADNSSLPQRVAIAANGTDLSAQMALRFGTAPYFIVVDLAANRFAAIRNSAVTDLRGYGIATAQLVATQGAQAAVAGAYGPQAYDTLKSLNVVPFIANPGKVSDILNQYRSALLTQVTDPTLPGYAYARSIITTGGPPSGDDDAEDEEEEGGYKGIPYTIPPQGKYDPALDPANAAELTAGSALNLNLNQQTQYCYCPTCNIVYEHPASVPCSSLACKECGSRLISLSSGVRSSQVATVAGDSLGQRVAIASNGNDLSAPMALRFGTAPYFIVVDLAANRFVAVRNSALASTGGYGIAAAQLVAAQGAQAAVAGAYRSQAYYALTALNVAPFVANPGRVSDVLNQYRLSALSRVTAQATAGSVTQRADYCYCASCGISVPHPAGVSCSQLTCSQCGNRLMNLDASGNLAPGMTGAAQPLPTYNQAPLPTQPLPTQPLSTYNQALLPTQTQTRTGSATAVAPGILPGSAGSLYLNQQPLYLNQQAQYCYCPLCNVAYERPAGVPCSSLVCKNCGSRLISLNPGAGMPTAGMPVAGMPTAGMPVAGMPTAGMPTAGMPVVGMPETIPPMGQTSAGTTNLPTGALQGTIDGNCVCPKCGTAVPHLRGTACYIIPCPKCGTLMVNEGAVLNSLGVAGTVVSGMPETIPPMGQTSAGTVVAGMPVAGMPISGMPATIPPTGGANLDNTLTVAGVPNISTGTVVGGQPDGMPPSMGQASAGILVAGIPVTIPPTGGANLDNTLTVAGVPNISTGIVVSGMPETIPPMGQTSAGILVSGMPETIPPMGQTSSVITVADDAASSALTVAGAGSGKVCIAATGSKIDSPVAGLFDRAPYFLMVGLGSFTAIPNPNVRDVTGAGIQSAQLVVSEGAKAVITNDIGIKAIEELKKLQVQVYTGVTGSAGQALEWYQNNRLTPTKLSASSATDDDDEEEEQHGPPTSKAKAKGETKTL